jgi:hypothetical protein
MSLYETHFGTVQRKCVMKEEGTMGDARKYLHLLSVLRSTTDQGFRKFQSALAMYVRDMG